MAAAREIPRGQVFEALELFHGLRGDIMPVLGKAWAAARCRALCVLYSGWCLAMAFNGQAIRAEEPQGSSTREAREDALRAIPYRALNADGRRKVDAVLDNVTVFRRMPTQSIPCDPDLFLFMVRHPDVIVDLWRALGISNISLVRTGPDTFHGRDTEGSMTDIQFLYSSSDTHLIYAVGNYVGGVFTKPVQGGCLLVLKSGYTRDSQGKVQVTSRLDAFFRVDHAGVEFMAKTFQSLIGKTADSNFVDTARFFNQLSRVAETKPEMLESWSERLVNVSPHDRQAFASVVSVAAEKAGNPGNQLERPRSVAVDWDQFTAPRGASNPREGRFQR